MVTQALIQEIDQKNEMFRRIHNYMGRIQD